ncbi:hypothetical protein DUI87_34708 [Hirundo rustica rustica]|uniref:Uncharacterized protein n=1 Tax=Hirundo rustica rustica TaxID=333673 RepID=A0A3M0IKR9_HIRRU|nr:hypothetical protein DUI87_34708 [Hirundo rustica rustica]
MVALWIWILAWTVEVIVRIRYGIRQGNASTQWKEIHDLKVQLTSTAEKEQDYLNQLLTLKTDLEQKAPCHELQPGSSEQGPHIPYNKPHLLKPNFRDLSSTFIYTVLESSAAGGSYFYNWRTTWKTPDPAFQAVRDFPMDGQTENCFALADASCLKSEDPPPPIPILEGPQKCSDDLQLTDWHEVTREICKEENLNLLAMPVIFSQQAGGPRTGTPIPSQDMKELQKVIKDSGICSSYFKELLKNTLERTHQTIKRILTQVKRGKAQATPQKRLKKAQNELESLKEKMAKTSEEIKSKLDEREENSHWNKPDWCKCRKDEVLYDEATMIQRETDIRCQHKITEMVALTEKYKNEYDKMVEEKDAELKIYKIRQQNQLSSERALSITIWCRDSDPPAR